MTGELMNILLVIAVVVILVAILGFTGLVAVLRAGAWLILLIGVAILVVSFLL
jgi:hypothetical protein